MEVVLCEDGVARCWWGSEGAEYRPYHDKEWGFGVADDRKLFEKVCLEGFQAGLSWLTILRKRKNFRKAFAKFDPEKVSRFGESEIQELLANEGIVRHEGKIRSTINNAARALELADEYGSLAKYFWQNAKLWRPAPTELTPITPESTALAKDLKKRGWTFVGPTTMYAFMQATGIVNDHLAGCHIREHAEASRFAVARRLTG